MSTHHRPDRSRVTAAGKSSEARKRKFILVLNTSLAYGALPTLPLLCGPKSLRTQHSGCCQRPARSTASSGLHPAIPLPKSDLQQREPVVSRAKRLAGPRGETVRGRFSGLLARRPALGALPAKSDSRHAGSWPGGRQSLTIEIFLDVHDTLASLLSPHRSPSGPHSGTGKRLTRQVSRLQGSMQAGLLWHPCSAPSELPGTRGSGGSYRHARTVGRVARLVAAARGPRRSGAGGEDCCKQQRGGSHGCCKRVNVSFIGKFLCAKTGAANEWTWD